MQLTLTLDFLFAFIIRFTD